MCYNKKRIKNPVKDDHKTGFDKTYILAPCCKCPSCRKVKSNDWLVRSYFEFMNTHQQAFFVSLDFDNDHLPFFKGIPCWDSDIMKDFLKRLRNRIGKFRYLYATDYGGFLHRPHYHMMAIPSVFMSESAFIKAIQESWQQGSYTDIQSLECVDGNISAAVEYVCGYVNKDIAFNPDDDFYKNMPLRFRPRVQASKGFGLRALTDGKITEEMILSGSKVTIPIGKNGRLVSFPIPRYYEMKLCYNYHYDPKTRLVELTKNDLGVKLAVLRHNRCYVFQYNDFYSSRFSDLGKYNVSGQDWHSVVSSCLENSEDFLEFLYFRPFLTFHGNHFVLDSVRNEKLFRPHWSYFEYVYSQFESWKKWIASVKCERETNLLIESAKARGRRKIERNSQLRNYLIRKGVDLSFYYT